MSEPTPPIIPIRKTTPSSQSPPPPLVINQNLYPKLNFSPAQFIPLAVMGKVPNAILTQLAEAEGGEDGCRFCSLRQSQNGGA